MRSGVVYGRDGRPEFAWVTGGDSLDECRQLAEQLLELATCGNESGSGSADTTTVK